MIQFRVELSIMTLFRNNSECELAVSFDQCVARAIRGQIALLELFLYFARFHETVAQVGERRLGLG